MLKAATVPFFWGGVGWGGGLITPKRPATLQNLGVTVRLSVAFVCKSLTKTCDVEKRDDHPPAGR